MAEAATVADVWVDLAGDDQSAPQWPYAVHAMIKRLEVGAARLQAVYRQEGQLS